MMLIERMIPVTQTQILLNDLTKNRLSNHEQLTLTDLNECWRVSLVLSCVPPRGQNLQQPLLNSLHKKHHHNLFHLYFLFTGNFLIFILPSGVLVPAIESCTAQDASVLYNISGSDSFTRPFYWRILLETILVSYP